MTIIMIWAVWCTLVGTSAVSNHRLNKLEARHKHEDEMKTRELIRKGFKPMIDGKGRARLVYPLLDFDPEYATSLSEPQVDAAVRAAAEKAAPAKASVEAKAAEPGQ